MKKKPDQPDFEFHKKMNQFELIMELFQEAKDDYVSFMKKCVVLKEMSMPENKEKWVKARIKNRYSEKAIPYYGTFV